ncbi:hypothetical protein SEA_NICEHOUSE_262 [Rhodococcus phage NiceHouse]|nr:hypothetical protein SEA_NICEHOUSE_262 [Rhodococcus phage NiceHouse]
MLDSITDLSLSAGVEIIEGDKLRIFTRNVVSSVYITADEADALRLWLDDHVQTKNVLV